MKKKIMTLLVVFSTFVSLLVPVSASEIMPATDILHYDKVVILETLERGQDRVIKKLDAGTSSAADGELITLTTGGTYKASTNIISIISGIITKSVLAASGLFDMEVSVTAEVGRNFRLNFPTKKHIAYIAAIERYNFYKVEHIYVTDYGAVQKETSKGVATISEPQHVYIGIIYEL